MFVCACKINTPTGSAENKSKRMINTSDRRVFGAKDTAFYRKRNESGDKTRCSVFCYQNLGYQLDTFQHSISWHSLLEWNSFLWADIEFPQGSTFGTTSRDQWFHKSSGRYWWTNSFIRRFMMNLANGLKSGYWGWNDSLPAVLLISFSTSSFIGYFTFVFKCKKWVKSTSLGTWSSPIG